MESELRPYLELPYSVEKAGSKEFYRVNIGNKPAVIVLSGIGKVNASYAASLLIQTYKPELVISTGVSGGLGVSNLLDIIVAEKTCQYDVDTSALGDPVGFVSTVNKVYFDTDPLVSDKFCEILDAKKGILACGDRFIAQNEEAKRIAETFGASACDMESGAIGQVCFIENVPYAAIRCVSDGAGEDAGISYNELVDKASFILARAVIGVLGQI